MSRWLALGDPVIRVTVRLPRLKSKDERLRERAAAYVERTWPERPAWDSTTSSGEWKRVRVQIRLAERKAVIKRVRRIPAWRPLRRRRALRAVLWTYGVPKWW